MQNKVEETLEITTTLNNLTCLTVYECQAFPEISDQTLTKSFYVCMYVIEYTANELYAHKSIHCQGVCVCISGCIPVCVSVREKRGEAIRVCERDTWRDTLTEVCM